MLDDSGTSSSQTARAQTQRAPSAVQLQKKSQLGTSRPTRITAGCNGFNRCSEGVEAFSNTLQVFKF
eukprot:2166009-Rhodomonas_salina.1